MDISILNKWFDIYLTLDIRWREIHKVGACVITAAISTAHQTCQHSAHLLEHQIQSTKFLTHLILWHNTKCASA